MANGNERRNRDKAMASYLKERGITRDTGQCPWGCNHAIKNGGSQLLIHLNVCKGSPRIRRMYSR